MTRLKICGLFRPEDIQFVNEAQPDWCGFVINFPKSHRSVSPAQLRELRAGLSPEITPVGVFVNQPVSLVAALLNDGVLSVAQLHGGEDDAYISSVRREAPGCEIWKAFRVCSPLDLQAALESRADRVLLDNGAGTGEAFRWSLAAGFPRPFLLAGGLTPQTIPEAIAALHPYGVDISSGVETGRVKDREKIIAAAKAVRKEPL